MKTILACALVSLFTLTAFAADGVEHHPHPPVSPAPIMLGQWRSVQPIPSNGIWIHTFFNFAPREMTMHATCQFGNPPTSLTVGVATRAQYNGNLIYVHDSVEAIVQDNWGRYCRAQFQPATWEFYMQSPDMTQAVIFAPVPFQYRIPVVRVVN